MTSTYNDDDMNPHTDKSEVRLRESLGNWQVGTRKIHTKSGEGPQGILKQVHD